MAEMSEAIALFSLAVAVISLAFAYPKGEVMFFAYASTQGTALTIEEVLDELPRCATSGGKRLGSLSARTYRGLVRRSPACRDHW